MLTCNTTSAVKLKIIKSKKEVFSIMLKYSDGTPYDLSNATEISVSFFGSTDGTVVSCKLSDSEVSILSAATGKFLVTMGGLKSKQLKAGEDLSFQVDIVNNGDSDNPDVVQFIEMLDVVEDLFI